MQMNRRSLSIAAQAVAFSFLIISVNKASCESDAAESLADHLSEVGQRDTRQAPMRLNRLVRAAPLRWGKRSTVEVSEKEGPRRWFGKREDEDDEGLMRPVRAAPLRWGKRSVDLDDYYQYMAEKEEAEKRAPLRWGKRAPSRFGKRAPMRFGRKRAPMRFGKKNDGDVPLDSAYYLGNNANQNIDYDLFSHFTP